MHDNFVILKIIQLKQIKVYKKNLSSLFGTNIILITKHFIPRIITLSLVMFKFIPYYSVRVCVTIITQLFKISSFFVERQ